MAHAPPLNGGDEVQLWQTKKEQAQHQDLADLYSIIVAVEKLEKARRRCPPGFKRGGEPPDCHIFCWAPFFPRGQETASTYGLRAPHAPPCRCPRLSGVRARRRESEGVRGGVPEPHIQVQDASGGAPGERRAQRRSVHGAPSDASPEHPRIPRFCMRRARSLAARPHIADDACL